MKKITGKEIVRMRGKRLPTSDVCRILGVTRKTLSRWTNSGKIKCEKSKTTGRLYYTFSDLTPGTILNTVCTQEAANILSVTTCRIGQLVKDGKLRPIEGIRPRRFLLPEIMEYQRKRNTLADEDAELILSIPELLEMDTAERSNRCR